MLGLLVRSPWVDQILEGRKTWEIRGNNTKQRGRIALIKSGSSTVVGTCDLIEVRGPLTLEQMLATTDKHLTPAEELVVEGLPYKKTYAWVLADPRAFRPPVPYEHPVGAVVWVKLPEILEKRVYRSPGDDLRERFLQSLAEDLRSIGHRAVCEVIKGDGLAFHFDKKEFTPSEWHDIYLRIRNRALHEDEHESAFIRRHEPECFDQFLDGKDLNLEAIDPELVIVGRGLAHQRDRTLYRYCRHLQSVPTSRGMGRRVTAILYDRGQRQERVVMGVLSLASAGYTHGVRDSFLEWDQIDSRREAKRVRELGLQRIMQLSVCLAVQPYSQLRVMKLVALLSLSDPVCEAFRHAGRQGKDRTDEPLLAVLTTSAFGLHAAGFNRLQLKKIRVANQSPFERNELFKRIDKERTNETMKTTSRSALPPLSTMICSAATVEAARAVARFVLGNGLTRSDSMRSDHSKDRVIFRALSACGVPRHVLAVNEKGVYLGSLHDDCLQALKKGVETIRSPYRLPFEAAVAYWREHLLPAARRKEDFAEDLVAFPREQQRLSHILGGKTFEIPSNSNDGSAGRADNERS